MNVIQDNGNCLNPILWGVAADLKTNTRFFIYRSTGIKFLDLFYNFSKMDRF